MGLKLDIENFFHNNPVGETIEADAKAAWNELKALSTTDLESVVKGAATAVLNILDGGGSIGAAIDAAVVSAEAGFIAAGKSISKTTLATLATNIVNQVSTAATPAAA